MSDRAIIATLMALLVALPLAVAAALALTTLVWRWPRWLRLCLSVMAQAVACVPALALAWSFIGLWLGHLRWPVESLMPTPGGGGAAAVIWSWAPAIFLAALAPAAALLSFLLGVTQPRPAIARARGLKPAQWFDRHELPRLLGLLRPRVKWLALLTALGLVFAEQALRLPGLGASWDDAIRGADAAAWVGYTAAFLAIVALVSVACRVFLRRVAQRPRIAGNNGIEATVEGAVAIGLTRRRAWLRHAFPILLRRWAAVLLTAVAWLWLAWVQLAALAAQPPGATLAAACERALEDPTAPLRAAVMPALWALSLLLLGRIVAPRPRAPSSWPTHQIPPRRSSGSAT